MKRILLINQITLIIFLSSGFQSAKPSSEGWGYDEINGPETWPGLCKIGKKQSPINIKNDKTIRGDLGSLKLIRYDFAYSGNLTNTGHSVQINLSGVPVHLTGGGLTSIFVLEQMHFHWSAEHTINGIRDVLELHLVHYDQRYGNFSTAMQYENGICVVAVLFQISSNDNKNLHDILNATKAVAEWVGPSTVEIPRKLIPILLLPKDQTSFYKYEGSLTTPGCDETVTWFIFTEKLTISESQLQMFKNVRNEDGVLSKNYRTIQNTGNRKIYHHLLGYSSAISSYNFKLISPINFILFFSLYILIN